jgi:hypothetical protein
MTGAWRGGRPWLNDAHINYRVKKNFVENATVKLA